MAVPEVVVQGRHLLGVLLSGEDLRGELSQLEGRTATRRVMELHQSFQSKVLVFWTRGGGEVPVTTR